MELTLDAATSTGGMIGHLSYLLLILSMSMRTMWLLRIFALTSSFVGIYYSSAWLQDPVGFFWESLLVLVNVTQLTITYCQNRRFSFGDEEGRFVDHQLPGLSNKLKRKLLDLGHWEDIAPNAVLTREGEPAERLFFLVAGEVEIISNEIRIGRCGADSFVGEMSVLAETPGSATAIAGTGVRAWSIPAAALQTVSRKNPKIDQVLKASFHRGVLEKLVRSNLLIESMMASPPGHRAGPD